MPSSRIWRRRSPSLRQREANDHGFRRALAPLAWRDDGLESRATKTGRCFASPGKRRLSRWRCRSTNAAYFPEGMGRRARRGNQDRRRRPATPIPARPTITTGSPRSSGSSPRRGLPTHELGAHPRRVAARLRAHAARHSDRAAAGRFRRIGFAHRPARFQAARDCARRVRRRRRWPEFAPPGARGWRPARSDTRDRGA